MVFIFIVTEETQFFIKNPYKKLVENLTSKPLKSISAIDIQMSRCLAEWTDLYPSHRK